MLPCPLINEDLYRAGAPMCANQKGLKCTLHYSVWTRGPPLSTAEEVRQCSGCGQTCSNIPLARSLRRQRRNARAEHGLCPDRPGCFPGRHDRERVANCEHIAVSWCCD